MEEKEKQIDVVAQQDRNVADLLEIRYLTKENAKFARTKGGFVSLDYRDEHYDRVALHRAFPFTDPDKYISVRESDPKAREIGIIKDLNELDEQTAELLREQMNVRYFTPKIIGINDVKDEYGYAYFDVRTDHGDCRFTTWSGGGSIARLSETRLIFSDIDGNRFELPDIRKLTPAEQKKIDVYI